ncbi:phosphoglycerate kinase [Candidatus Parcubacteria bacterium]|nr:phosphoglycerate kinase [Candidatus Parcubacteria bacterium]
MLNKKTVNDIELKGKTVLVRTDYNVPLDKKGRIVGDFRMKSCLPNLRYLLKQNCKIVICSHMGRPKDSADKHLSLKPVAKHLEGLLGQEIAFADDCIGEARDKQIKAMKPGEILLLENLRYYPEETANDAVFAKKLANNCDILVQNGFGVLHRKHASTDAITRILPAVAGLLVEKEIKTIKDIVNNPKRPLMAIVGGAKISDKMHVLELFIDIADVVAIGGAMSNTFLLAQGVKIGDSLAEPNDIELARKILDKARAKAKKGSFVFYIPQDGVVAKKAASNTKTRIVDWGTHAIAEIEDYPKHPNPVRSLVAEDEMILDIGPFSGAFIAGSMQLAGSVFWNGALGVTEIEALQNATGPFSHGTELVFEAILGQFGHRPYSLIGGGDTVGFVESKGLADQFDHVSTGGGASLELLVGKKLPGIEALQDK